MDITAWITLGTICLLGAMSPGPSLAVIVRHTLKSGRLYGVICAWSHATGIGIYALISLTGLALVIKQAPLLFKATSLCSALYLGYLGFQALLSKKTTHLEGEQESQHKKPLYNRHSVTLAIRDSLGISLLNPKTLIFFLALFGQYIPNLDSTIEKTLVTLMPLVIDGIWFTFVALMLSHPKILPKLRQKGQTIDRLTGIILLLLAAHITYNTLVMYSPL